MQSTTNQKTVQRIRRRRRIRARVSGTAVRPRLAVFRSNAMTYAQLIDDTAGVTIASAHNMKAKGTKLATAEAVGEAIAAMATKKNVKEVVFDRAGYIFTGRVKAVAEGARKGGLKF